LKASLQDIFIFVDGRFLDKWIFFAYYSSFTQFKEGWGSS